MILSPFIPLVAEPVHPAWWNDRGVKNTSSVQNLGVANIGQLKHIATQAHAELESLLPGGAGFYLPFGPPPENPDAAWYDNQKKVLQLGVMKRVAKDFYDQLNGISSAWVESQLQANGLTTLNTDYFQDATTGYFYPWNPTTPVAENYKVATVGQLKLVFCLRLGQDTDGDSLPDLWEHMIISADPNDGIVALTDVLLGDDYDNDTVSNLEEYQNGLSPVLEDSDGDGLDDSFRIGLLGSWKLDTTAGTVLEDDSLSKMNGELLSGTRIANGLSGGAVSLTADQQMRITPDPAELNVGDNGSDFTVSFWIRLHADHEPGWNTILQKGDTDQKRTFHLSLKPDGQKLHARLTSDDNVNEGIEESVHNMVPGEWTHVSYVHDSGELKLYVNGLLDSTATVGQSIGNDDPFYIGKSPWLGGVNADFDAITVHDRALGDDKVDDVANVDTDGDGMTDVWEDANGMDSDDASDADVDNDGDGLTNQQEQDLGRDPNTADVMGPVNSDFSDTLASGEVMSFRDEYPSDLYFETDVPGWEATDLGGYIEIWQEDDGDTYVELQAHYGAHGIKQQFPMLSESRKTYILRYKGRYQDDDYGEDIPYHNAFELKVEGASELTVDGIEVSEDNGVRTHSFIDSEEWEEWQYAVVTITAPENEAGLEDITLTLAPDEITDSNGEDITHGGFVSLLPVEVEELSPKLRDESDVEIAGSEKPAVAPKSTEMVERDPSATPTALNDASAIRIAWRDMKVKIGKPLAGKTVTWSMTPQFTPLQADGTPEAAPRFRGKWGSAAIATYRHRFSATEKYKVVDDDYDYESMTQMLETGGTVGVTITAQTTVDADGYTAIRVNLPPIGFNKARIKIEIEDVEDEIDLIDLEVPAVIVIDPGHGTGGFTDGSAGGSVGLHTNVTEGDAALNIGTRTLNEIARLKDERGLLIKKYSTKPSNNPRVNIGLNDREEKARQFGADTYVSLHFDSATTDPNNKAALYRNPFGMIDQDDTLWNRNPRADWALALRVRIAVQAAIAAIEPAESIQASETAYDEWDAAHNPDAERVTSETNESRLQKGLGALNDGNNPGQHNGNYRAGDIRYTPCRATLIEMERTANEQADNLFNGNTAYNSTTGVITLTALAESMRARVATNIAGACIDDLLIRDLADQAIVPLRTDPRPGVPRLDFENN